MFRLQYLFSNLSEDEMLLVQSTRLQAMAVQLVYIVRASNTSALALSDHFVSRVEVLKKYLSLIYVSLINFINNYYLFIA